MKTKTKKFNNFDELSKFISENSNTDGFEVTSIVPFEYKVVKVIRNFGVEDEYLKPTFIALLYKIN